MSLALIVAANIVPSTLVVGGLAFVMTRGTAHARQPALIADGLTPQSLSSPRNKVASASGGRSVSAPSRALAGRPAALSGSTR
jgi:hypothetical protein